MRTPIQNNRLSVPKKASKVNQRCANCKKMPSEQNCSKCIANMIDKFSKDSYEDEDLTTDEKITKWKKDLDNLKLIPTLIFQVYETILEKKLQIENEKRKNIVSGEVKNDSSSPIEENKSIIVKKRIPIIGKKSVVGYKIGKFFFNPENKDGFHLPKIHETAIIELFCESFESIDGTEYSSRYLLDNVITGANKDLDEENQN